MAKDIYKDIHTGHRERLKNRFLNEGLDDFEKHNILEPAVVLCNPESGYKRNCSRFDTRVRLAFRGFQCKL